MASLDDTLEARGGKYGPFVGHANATQQIMAVIQASKGEGWRDLSPGMTAVFDEALHMIAHKIGRIVNGDPTYDDSWVDIAGYAELVVRCLRPPVPPAPEVVKFNRPLTEEEVALVRNSKWDVTSGQLVISEHEQD